MEGRPILLNVQSEEAANYIVSYCHRIGSFCNVDYVGDVFGFLEQTAMDIQKYPSNLFPARYGEHISCAIAMIAKNPFLSSPSAIASSYLATRFEYFFRCLSCHLNTDGSWVDKAARENASLVLEQKFKGKISNVAMAYQIMKLNQSNSKVSALCHLDALMPKDNRESSCASIGKRIEWCRHRTAHGEWGDISGESIFYGLLTALIFYS